MSNGKLSNLLFRFVFVLLAVSVFASSLSIITFADTAAEAVATDVAASDTTTTGGSGDKKGNQEYRMIREAIGQLMTNDYYNISSNIDIRYWEVN